MVILKKKLHILSQIPLLSLLIFLNKKKVCLFFQRSCVNAEETRFGVVVSDVSMSLKEASLLLGLGPVF